MSFDRTEQNPKGTGDKTLRDQGLTLMYPCFGQEKRIYKLLKIWDAWSDDIKDNVQILLIDDHGTPSVENMLSDKTMDYNLSVYRIQNDLKYNIKPLISSFNKKYEKTIKTISTKEYNYQDYIKWYKIYLSNKMGTEI